MSAGKPELRYPPGPRPHTVRALPSLLCPSGLTAVWKPPHPLVRHSSLFLSGQAETPVERKCQVTGCRWRGALGPACVSLSQGACVVPWNHTERAWEQVTGNHGVSQGQPGKQEESIYINVCTCLHSGVCSGTWPVGLQGLDEQVQHPQAGGQGGWDAVQGSWRL